MATMKPDDRRMYRFLSLAALVVGAGALVFGALYSNANIMIAGGIIALVHGVTAQIVLATADRRKSGSGEV